jgi:hypothetical protein
MAGVSGMSSVMVNLVLIDQLREKLREEIYPSSSQS